MRRRCLSQPCPQALPPVGSAAAPAKPVGDVTDCRRVKLLLLRQVRLDAHLHLLQAGGQGETSGRAARLLAAPRCLFTTVLPSGRAVTVAASALRTCGVAACQLSMPLFAAPMALASSAAFSLTSRAFQSAKSARTSRVSRRADMSWEAGDVG